MQACDVNEKLCSALIFNLHIIQSTQQSYKNIKYVYSDVFRLEGVNIRRCLEPHMCTR